MSGTQISLNLSHSVYNQLFNLKHIFSLNSLNMSKYQQEIKELHIREK